MTTNQMERVSDEELDQMIWKLERDGMTPKMLSLMREVREVRRAKGEPVAYADPQALINFKSDEGKITACTREWMWRRPGKCLIPLYTAPPEPVVMEEMTACKAYDLLMEKGGVMSPVDSFVFAWNTCRAAMQLSGNSEQLEPVSNRDELNSPETPDGWKLVPEEPTHEILEAGDAQFGTYDVYRRMIEAAPKEVG